VNFLDRFSTNNRISNVMNIHPVAASCPSGRTDKTNIIVTFRSFANVPKIDKTIIFNTVLVTQELFEI